MSLKYKIAVTIFLLQAALLTVVVWQVASITSEHAQVRLADADKHMSDLLTSLARVALVRSDYASLADPFRELRRDAHIDNLVLADASGRVVAGTNAELLGRPLPAPESTADRYWKRIEITGGSGHLGTLAVQYSEVPFHARDRAAWIGGVGISLIGLLLITSVGIFMGFLLTRRLNRLAVLADTASLGNVDVDFRLPGHDETARLAAAFDQMFRALNEQISHRRNEEDRFRDLAAAVADWYWETDKDHRFCWISEQYTDHSELTVDDVIGRTHWELVGVDPKDDPDLGRLVEDFQARRPFRDFRFSRTDADGRELYRVANGIPRFDEAGGFIGYRGTGTDITDRVELERAYRAVVETAPVSMLVQDGETILFANAACAELYGARSPDDLVGKRVLDLIHPAHHDEFHGRLDKLLASKKPLPTVMQRRKRLDGSEFMAQSRSAPIVWDGQPALMGFQIDLSDLIEAQEKLQRSEERYRQLFDITPAAVLVQTDDVIRFANPAAVDMFHAGTVEKMVGMSSLDICHPDHLPQIMGERRKIAASQKSSEFIQARQMRLDGTSFHSMGRGVPISWEGRQGLLLLIQDVSEQIAARDELQKSEERYRELFDITPAGVLVITNDVIRFANPAAVEMFHAGSADDLVEMPAQDIVHPDSLPEIREERRQVAQSRRTTEFAQVRHIRLDGTSFHSIGRAAQISWEGEQGFLIVLQDASERINAEDELRRSEERYRQLFDVTPAAVLVQTDSVIRFANDAAVKLFKVASPENLVGLSSLDIVHPDSLPAIREIRRQVDETQEPSDFLLVRQIRPDGTSFDSEGRIAPISWEGRPGHLIVLHDVSERLKAEDELRRSEERYRQLFDLSPEALLVQVDGVIRFANTQAVKMFHAGSLENLFGASSRDLIHPDDWPAVVERRERISETNKPSGFAEVKQRRLDGTSFYSESKSAPLSWGGRPALLVVIRDISERREAEQALKKAESERFEHSRELANVQRRSILGEMASAMAHELNQPMTAIVNYANGAVRRLESTGQGTPELKEALEQVSSQAERASKIVRWARRFARNSDVDRDRHSINDLIRSALVFVEPELKQTSIALDIELSAASPVAEVNDVEFEQVFLNLIRNAIEALQDTSRKVNRIAVRTEVNGDEGVTITVSDTGPGIPRVIAERIFEPFFTTKEKGVGMGLAICRTIMEGHGGELSIGRTGADGTTVKLVLPLVHKASTYAA